NHSVPPGYVAKFKGMKVVSIESSLRFTSPSRSIKTLSKISDLLALQWPEQKEFFPQGVIVGPLYELPEYKPKDEGYVLVTGGTYGHRLLFEAVDKLEVEKVVLQTGRINPRPFKERHPGWTVFDFDPDFGKWLAGASVVVTHFGKTAIDAALTYGKPVVLVPNPEWRLTASLEDARMLAEKLNAVLVEEINPLKLREVIEEAKSREPPSYPDGAAKLVELILEL
ncbi:MAG: polysaccharide biosynthesis protein, partial [Thermoprotei archaeon]